LIAEGRIADSRHGSAFENLLQSGAILPRQIVERCARQNNVDFPRSRNPS
jgi:hypothetical protein